MSILHGTFHEFRAAQKELALQLIAFQMEQMFTKPMGPRELLIHLL